MKAALTDEEIWERFKEIVDKEILPYERVYEVSLAELGYLIFGDVDENDLKGLNQRLTYVLKKHKIRVIMRGGRRYALIPERLLKESEAPKKRKRGLEHEV